MKHHRHNGLLLLGALSLGLFLNTAMAQDEDVSHGLRLKDAQVSYNSPESPMLIDIENNALAFLNGKLAVPARSLQVKGITKTQSLAMPEVNVACMRGNFVTENMVRRTFKQEVRLYVILDFQNLNTEKARHLAAFPILEALMSNLSGEKLGMDITPIEPVSWQNVTDPAEDGGGRIILLAEFSTSFQFHKIPDAEAESMVTASLQFLLQPASEYATESADLTGLS